MVKNDHYYNVEYQHLKLIQYVIAISLMAEQKDWVAAQQISVTGRNQCMIYGMTRPHNKNAYIAMDASWIPRHT